MKTVHLSLNVPPFDTSPWHDLVNDNFKSLDALIHTMFGITNIKGVYLNSTAVIAGERYIDATTGEMFEVVTGYVTDPAPTTFATDRNNHPANWLLIDASAALSGLAQMLTIRDEVIAAKTEVNNDQAAINALLATLSMSALETIGGTPEIVTDWNNAKNFPNTIVYADAAASLLPSGFEFGVVGSPGRAGLGFYYALDANNGYLQIVALASGNRWYRRYEGGVWIAWSKLPNANEVVRRDYKLTGNAEAIVDTAVTNGADIYKVDTGASNLPSWAALNDTILGVYHGQNDGSLICFGRNGKIAIKGKAANVWGAWIEYQTPSDITNVVNTRIARNTLFAGDFNALISNTGTVGCDVVIINTGATNIPTWASIGDTIITTMIDQNNGQQIHYGKSGKISTRGKNGGVWSGWLETLTGIIESPQQTFAASAVTIWAHGLGTIPKFVEAILVPVITSGEGAIGEHYRPSDGTIALTFDATNIYLRVSNLGILKVIASNVTATLTPANWRIVFRAAK